MENTEFFRVIDNNNFAKFDYPIDSFNMRYRYILAVINRKLLKFNIYKNIFSFHWIYKDI